MITRVPQEPERPDRLHRHSGRETGTDNSQAPGGASAIEGNETRTQRWYRQVKATQRGETGGRESEHPIVPTKSGNRPSWTRRREGDAASWKWRLEPREGIEPHERVTARASKPAEGRHHGVTSQMREIRTSGSVGARGEQSPWATRPFSAPSGSPFRLPQTRASKVAYFNLIRHVFCRFEVIQCDYIARTLCVS